MARKRKSVEPSEGRNPGLTEPWPSSPTRPPRFSIKFTNLETNRIYFVNAHAVYAAKKILDMVVGDRTLVTNPKRPWDAEVEDIDIHSQELEDILDHEYSAAEEAWQLTQPYTSDIERFLTGVATKSKISDSTETRSETPRPAKDKAAPKEKIDRTGLISISDICKDMNIEAGDARAALRKAKWEKPKGGWLFKAEDVEGVKKILRAI